MNDSGHLKQEFPQAILVLLVAAWLVMVGQPAGGWGGPQGIQPPPAERGDCIIVTGFNDRCSAWSAAYNVPSYTGLGGGEDIPSDMAISPDGKTIYVTGWSWLDAPGAYPYTGYDAATVAYDTATGEQLWVARYDGGARANDGGKAVGVDPGGERVFVTGAEGRTADSSFEGDLFIVAYDAATGRELWRLSYNGGSDLSDAGTTIVVSPDGDRGYVGGYQDAPDKRSYAVVAFDADSGESVWSASYPAGYTSGGLTSLQMDPTGTRLYASGASKADGTQDVVTIAYNARDEDPAEEGSPLWIRTFRGAPNAPVASLQLSPDAELVLVSAGTQAPVQVPGTDPLRPNVDFATVAYDSDTGATHWQAGFDGGGSILFNEDIPNDLAVSGDSVFVIGTSDGPTGCTLTAVAHDISSGTIRWSRRIHLPFLDDCTEGKAVALSPDGNQLLVGGNTIGTGGVGIPSGGVIYHRHYLVASLDPLSGEQNWVARFNSSPYGLDTDFAHAMVVSPDGRGLFITGSFGYQPPAPLTQNTWDYGTVAFDL